VVQNGEIYDHAQLHAALERAGHRFASRCDTEVLVHGYEEYGLELFARLRGMWAVAIWDAAARRLVLAVDPFAIKPLYVHAGGGRVAFASELGALRRCAGVPGDLDPDALQAFLAFNAIPPPLSILRGVRKLAPGELLIADAGGGVEVRRWARPGPAPLGALADAPRAALAGQLRALLRDSVRAHLVADVPVGVFLSGGIDSGALAALAAEQVGRISTFSVGFEEASFDERERARLVARRYETDHHEVELRAADAAVLLPEVAAAFDEPFADSSMLPTWLVSRLARSRVTVALSGEGGDELFGGYKTYAASALAMRVGRVAALGAPLAARIPSGDRRVGLEYQARALHGGGRAPRARAPPRVQGDPRAAAARRAAGRGGRGPRRAAARAVRRDGGRGADRAAAGRRPRRHDGRRPAHEIRPGEHGALARGPGAVLRRGGRRVRPPPPARRPGAGAAHEGPAARGRGPAASRRGRRWPQARVLDARRGVAAWPAGPPGARGPRPDGAARRRRARSRAGGAADGRARRAPRDHSRAIWGLLCLSLWLRR
jgi:asparagine synthase (glutamine-hydrolysing)